MVGEKTVTSVWSIMDDEDFLDTEDLGDFEIVDDDKFRLYLNMENTSIWDVIGKKLVYNSTFSCYCVTEVGM